jgi:hypothetical protein
MSTAAPPDVIITDIDCISIDCPTIIKLKSDKYNFILPPYHKKRAILRGIKGFIIDTSMFRNCIVHRSSL